MWKFVEISAAAGLDALTRANLISEELFNISRPPATRNPGDVSSGVFPVIEQGGKVYMMVDLAYMIPVHPLNNVNSLAALFPNISAAEKSALVEFINNSQQFQFGQILPSGTAVLESI